MSYTIQAGSTVRAIAADGKEENKLITKTKIYPTSAGIKQDDWLRFDVKPGGAWKYFMARREDVIETIDIVGVVDGTFAVSFGDNDDDYITLRFQKQTDKLNEDGQKNFFYGKQIVGFLDGPDDENNFTNCIHIDENGSIRLWKRFRVDKAFMKLMYPRIKKAIVYLQEHGTAAQSQAGMKYALRSKRCWRCGRRLKVSASLYQGMGPDCAKKDLLTA